MINKQILLGRVGKDPDIKNFDNGGKIALFTLATSESYKNKDGERVENTEWHNISASNKLADIVEKYVRKGDLLYIEGKKRTRSYEANGETKYIAETILNGFDCTLRLMSKAQNETATVNEALPKSDLGSSNKKEEDDDLPF